MQNKILVIRGGAIGDFILTLPALAALRAHFPKSRIEVLGYPHIARLAEVAGFADAVRSIEARALAGFFARHGQLDETLQAYFADFALIISYLYDPDGIFQENIARATKAQFIPGPHRPDDRAGVHATEVFLRPLERLAIFGADATSRLPFRSTNRASDLLAIHPGSGSEKKNWPEHNWADLLRRIANETHWRVLLVGGEAEEGKLDRLARNTPSDRIQIARSLPLTELATRLAECTAFLGHDSGITHLAAAVGTRVLALWADTPEQVWRPKTESLVLLRSSGGLDQLSPDALWPELTGAMSGADPRLT